MLATKPNVLGSIPKTHGGRENRLPQLFSDLHTSACTPTYTLTHTDPQNNLFFKTLTMPQVQSQTRDLSYLSWRVLFFFFLMSLDMS